MSHCILHSGTDFWNSSGSGPPMGFSNLKSGICEQLPLGHDLSGPVTRFPVPPSFWNSSGLGPLMGFSNLNSDIYKQLHPSFWNWFLELEWTWDGPMGFSNLNSRICEQLRFNSDLVDPVTRFPVLPPFWNSFPELEWIRWPNGVQQPW